LVVALVICVCRGRLGIGSVLRFWTVSFVGDPVPLWDPPGGDSATPRRSGGDSPKWVRASLMIMS